MSVYKPFPDSIWANPLRHDPARAALQEAIVGVVAATEEAMQNGRETIPWGHLQRLQRVFHLVSVARVNIFEVVQGARSLSPALTEFDIEQLRELLRKQAAEAERKLEAEVAADAEIQSYLDTGRFRIREKPLKGE